MSSKYKYWMLLLTLLCVVSIVFSVLRVTPCEIGNDAFLGIEVSVMGIIVTLVMGYQIFSVVEFRGELQKQKEENQRLAKDNASLQLSVEKQLQVIAKQKSRIEEGINMCISYINYFSGQSVESSFGAFVPMLNALYYSVDSEEDDFEDIFSGLRLFIDKMQGLSFGLCCSQDRGDGKFLITESNHPFNGKTVDEYLDYCLEPIKEVDGKIRNHKRFRVIKYEYNSVMDFLDKKIKQICNDPQNLHGLDNICGLNNRG